MGVFLVRETEHADHSLGICRQHFRMQRAEHPVLAMSAASRERFDDSDFTTRRLSQPQYGRQVTLEIASCQSQARR